MKRTTFVGWLLSTIGLIGCAKPAHRSSMGNMSTMMGNRGADSMASSHRGSEEMSAMMGSVDETDMRVYMEMFDRHREIRRSVQTLPNGVRTVTESSNPRIVALLQTHVEKMYEHVANGQEVRCMSDSLPTMFRNASKYRRQLTLTPDGVAIEETSNDPVVIAALHRHANEVTAFVREGMPAMMRGMMP
jgi:hypothetical protein